MYHANTVRFTLTLTFLYQDSEPFLSTSESDLENSIDVYELPRSMFHVLNVGGEGRLDIKGILQVTRNEVIFTDQETSEVFIWPLIYMRRYGGDSELFSFEVGRKSPGGEGLYAFKSQCATEIFDMVARNMKQIGKQPSANETSSESQPPDQNTPMKSSVSELPYLSFTAQPNSGNLGQAGNLNVQVENNLQPTLPKRPVEYKDCPPEQHQISLEAVRRKAEGKSVGKG